MTPISTVFFKPKSGQAGLVAIAVSILLVMVIGGASLSNMSLQSSQRNIVDRRTMQAYYIAQAGLQEALATRMIPRSNFLNFIPNNTAPYNIPVQVTAPYSSSGLVYQKPGTANPGLLGVYRYLIVGGDPSRDANGNYYGIPPGSPPYGAGVNVTNNAIHTPRLVTFQSNPPASPFFVISNGMTCIRANGTKGVDQGIDQFQGAAASITSAKQLSLSNSLAPQCKPGYTLQEMTLVAQVSLEQENGNKDKVDLVRTFPNHQALTLPASAFVPGSGWTNAVNFDTAWSSTSTVAGKNPARPTRLVFFKFGTNKIYHVQSITGASPVTSLTAVPADASMMLTFDGPIDYRSLSTNMNGAPASMLYDKDLAGCKGNNSKYCAIQMLNPLTNTPYTGMLVVPILPYQTKVLLLAPLGNNLNPGQFYSLQIYTNRIRSASYTSGYNSGAVPLVVKFKTK